MVTVRSSRQTIVSANSSSWTLVFPFEAADIKDGGSTYVQAGDLIMVNIGRDGSAGTGSISGFTSLFDQAANGNAARGLTFVKVATGSESNLTYTVGASEQGVARVVVLKGWYGSLSGGVEASTPVTGATVDGPDPPSFTPSWGAAETYWRACAAHDSGLRVIDAYPTNYTDNQNADASGGGNGAGLGSAGRVFNPGGSGAENPGPFSMDAADDWVAWVVAVRPANSVTKSVTVSGYLVQRLTKTVSVTGVLRQTFTKSVTASAVLQTTGTKTVSVDAVLVQVTTETKTVTLSAVLQRTVTASVALTGVLQTTMTKSVTVGGVVQRQDVPRAVTVSAVASATMTKTVAVSALLTQPSAVAVTVSAVLQQTLTQTVSLSATLSQSYSVTVGVTAVIQSTGLRTFDVSGVVQATPVRTVTLSALLQQSYTRTVNLDAVLQRTETRDVTVSGVVQGTFTKSVTLSGYIFLPGSGQVVSLDAVLQKTLTQSVQLTANLSGVATRTVTLDAVLQKTFTQSVTVGAVVRATLAQTLGVDALLQGTHTTTVTVSGHLLATVTRTVDVAGVLHKAGIPHTVTVSAVLSAFAAFTRTVTISAWLYRNHLETVAFGSLISRLIVDGWLWLGGEMADHINPMTDAEWHLTVKDKDGTVLSDATVAANVFSPTGAQVATSVSMAWNAATQTYVLNIDKAWSTVNNQALEGEFLAVVTVTRTGLQRVRRFRYVVRFDDDS